ncbi:MAG: hypothetical protein ABI837_09455 [Acidobacteriota bacterium]
MNFESRAGRRLRLARPVPALADGKQIEIYDLGLRGIGVEHDFPLTVGSKTFIEFSWGKALIHLACSVSRSREMKGRRERFRSGLTIERNSLSREEYVRRVEAALESLRVAEAKRPPGLS